MAITTAITTAVGMRVDWRPVVECLLAGVRLYIQFKKGWKRQRERETEGGMHTPVEVKAGKQHCFSPWAMC